MLALAVVSKTGCALESIEDKPQAISPFVVHILGEEALQAFPEQSIRRRVFL